MGTQKFDRSKWIDVCAAVSIAMLGKRAEIEVMSPADGILIEARWLPMIGIMYDPASDALKIMLDGVDHFVFQPREMYLDFGLGGIQSLGILDNENAWQIVLLRDPLMLPRPAATS
ncbi:MAG: hypothetical protein JWN43_4398 [Gammaproteobacteria bacterium]|nr:hypothetical protein [Gammaproteobacteria bacterium]